MQVLGGLNFSGPEGSFSRLTAGVNGWVCAILAVSAGRLGREQLAELLWPDLTPAAARSALRQRLHRMKQTPLASNLELSEYELAWTGESDLRDFRAACAAGDWERALGDYAGPLLQGVPFPPHQDLSGWLEEERSELHAEYLRVLWRAVRAREESLDDRGAASLLWRAADLHPDSSEIVEELLRCLLRLGERQEARLLLLRHAARLQASYGVGLPAVLEAWLPRLETSAQPAAWPSASGHPAARAAQLNGLPGYLTTFVGRRAELRRALGLLTDPQASSRWLTLSGPGGIGKTRLATELARQYAEQTGQDVLFVELAALGTQRQLLEALLLALGEPLEAAKPPQERLLEALPQGSLLLVLDNFEHLMEASALLPRLLLARPELRVLVTSRERLNYQSESVLRLGGLDDAGTDLAAPGDDAGVAGQAGQGQGRSVRLFAERASRADAGFEPARWAAALERIARRCQGLPLALELAAAWVGEYSPDHISARLDATWDFLHTTLRDVPERHRSLRTVFEYSWTALPPALQQSYAGLAVLRSAFGPQTAAQVAGVSQADLSLLERRSLLTRPGAGLYGWHENLRQYALEQLGSRLQELEDRHLDYFVRLAEEAAPRLRGMAQAQTLRDLQAQYPDLRSALSCALQPRHAHLGLRLAGALHWFWYVRGYHQQGLDSLNATLELNAALGLAQRGGTEVTPALALALRASASLASERGLSELAVERFGAALSACEALDDITGQAQVWHGLGILHRDREEYAQAQTELDRAGELWERCGDKYGAATTFNDQGILSAYQNDHAAARASFQRSLDLKREVGDLQGVAYALNNLSNVTGDLSEVLRLDQESLKIKQELGDVLGSAVSYINLSSTALQLGRSQEAAGHLVQALGLIQHLGSYALLPTALLEAARLAMQWQRPLVALTLCGAALHADGQSGVLLRASLRAKLSELSAQARAALHESEGARPGDPLDLPGALDLTLNLLNTDQALSAD
ncbi:AfsR/SARP family transcriptional regulator [Deinococcus sp.]|uniref:AfsR/SARP family transcriptional regulator n=1 Tax=Deinococcus sp. TaxID=47478 RepID=UPI003CC502C6